MGRRLRLLDKTVGKFAELPIYCQLQKCSPGKGRQMRVGSLNMHGDFRFIRLLSSEHFTYMATRQLSGDDCQWPWAYFQVITLFHINFLKNGAWHGNSYYRLLIGNHTLAYDWCHFWWPWSTFEGHFSLRCHFQSTSISAILGMLSRRTVSQQ